MAWNRVDRPVSGLLMIRNVLVMAKSGLVLFSREFANSVQQVCVCVLSGLWSRQLLTRKVTESSMEHVALFLAILP